MPILTALAGTGANYSGALMGYRVEDQILPADFPKPKPLTVESIVRDRDGSNCRFCSAHLEDAEWFVNVLPGREAGERPELVIVTACGPCERDAQFVADNPNYDANYGGYEQLSVIQERRRYRVLIRMMRLLYLENCELAKIVPLKEVAR